ncbi:MAG TPA: CpaF family protein, partial [Luteimonas sp.]|nr:CpaF family protein [Luteimonas sp.]
VALLQRLGPIVLERFGAGENAGMSRQVLSVRIAELVAKELEGNRHGINLVERRALVAELNDALIASFPPEPVEPAPRMEPQEPAPQRPAPALAPVAPPPQPSRAATPTPGSRSLAALGASNSGKSMEGLNAASRASVEEAKNVIQPLVVERIDITAAARLERDELRRQLAELVADVLREQKLRLNQKEQQGVVDLLLDDMLGLGPLEPLLADEAINDIMVNGPNQVYVERKGKLELTDVSFRDNQHLLNICTRIVSQIGRRVDESTPLCDARLMDGSRVNIIIPPLAIDGPSISIRKFAKKGITLDVMIKQRNISEACGTVLKVAARSRLNILISGGTGSGKTTLLNAMSQMIDPGERIVTIEDAAELQLQQPHVVRLETRPANLEGHGEVTMRDLVKNALRMRPDRIILGEVRGAEAVDMLQAMNTGHDGSLGTVHANRPREALTRLENMVGMAGINLPAKAVRTQIAAAVDLIVQVSRMRDGMRRITYVTEVVGMEGDVITTQDLFTYEFEGEDPDGKLRGSFRASGLRPNFTPKAAYFGLDRLLVEAMS